MLIYAKDLEYFQACKQMVIEKFMQIFVKKKSWQHLVFDF